jgi:hypothetical protein
MKKSLLLGLLSLVLLINCDETNNEITAENVAKGKVAGSDWEFGAASATSRLQFNDYKVTLMSTAENVASDPCSVVIPGTPYVQLTIPPALGNYSVSADANGVKFFDGSNATSFFTATSGFIQVVSFTSLDIEGFIQANFDDENTIEGYFLAQLCN